MRGTYRGTLYSAHRLSLFDEIGTPLQLLGSDLRSGGPRGTASRAQHIVSDESMFKDDRKVRKEER